MGAEASSVLQMGSSNVVAALGASTVGVRGSAVGWALELKIRRSPGLWQFWEALRRWVQESG